MATLFVLCVVWTLIVGALSLGRISVGWKLLATGWLTLTGLCGYYGFYADFAARPPRILVLVWPPLILLAWSVWKRRPEIDSINLRTLTLLHFVRVGVEACLWLLHRDGLIPQIMTFEGRNFDILAGLSAPLVGWFAFRNGRLNRPILIVWNLVSLALVLNIVIIAILSLPLPFQRFGLDQPNVAVVRWPYVWLPGVIVPSVIAAHLVVISRWWRGTLPR